MVAEQLAAVLEFGRQRLDELEAVSAGGFEAEKFAPLYHTARANVGTRSSLGQFLFDSSVERPHAALSSAAAAHYLAPLKRKYATKPQAKPQQAPPPKPAPKPQPAQQHRPAPERPGPAPRTGSPRLCLR